MMHTGKSLTVKNNNMKEGAEIVQCDYQGLNSQKWQIRDSGKAGWIISPLSNLQLSISIDGNIVNGAKLKLLKAKENLNQMFCLYNISANEKNKENGVYKVVVGKDTSKAIEVPGGNDKNNSQLGIWDYRKWNSSKSLL